MPLAHILYPALAKKTAEIEAELGPPGAQQGYLQAGNAGAGPTAADKAQKELRNPVGTTTGAPKRLDQVFLDAGVMEATRQDRRRRGTEPGMQMIPNAPVQQATPVPARTGYLALPSGPIGMDERGMPVNGPVTQPRTVTLPAGAIGTSEGGEQVDRKGKKLGYLTERGPASMDSFSPGHARKFDGARGADFLQRKYGEHLKATQYDTSKGTMTFPEGYFQGMSKKEVKDIREGVEALRQVEKLNTSALDETGFPVGPAPKFTTSGPPAPAPARVKKPQKGGQMTGSRG